MDSEILIAVLGCLGTVIGSGLGVVTSSKLTSYRLKKLEEQVQKHNSVVERTFVLEGKVAELRHDYSEIKSDLKKSKRGE